MKNKTAIVIILVIVALGLGLWTVAQRGGSERTNIVHAWQLTPDGAYNGDSIWDPVISWSPDSRSLLLAVAGPSYKQAILRWKVGDKELERVASGVSPNYIDNDHFIFLIKNPCRVGEHTLSTGAERLIINDMRNVDFWKDITAFSYEPARKTIALRFSPSFTRYYEPGYEEVDLTGKPLGRMPRTTGNGILDRSLDPTGRQAAEIIGELTGVERTLRVSDVGKESAGKQIAAGNLGAVAWSPDGKTLAYADSNEVKAMDPGGAEPITVARFGSLPITANAPYVCRLIWSPDSKYLAAVELVPNDAGGNVMAYVLDMNGRWRY